MTKEELIKKISQKAEVTQAVAKKCLDAFLETVKETVKKKEEVRLVGFGTFKVVKRKERKGKNPRTGEAITIPAKEVVKFIPGKDLNIEQ